MHSTKHPMSGKIVKIRNKATHPQVEEFGGSPFVIEDWYDRVSEGRTWMNDLKSPACIAYVFRLIENELPADDEVVYGKVGVYGHIVHISELEF